MIVHVRFIGHSAANIRHEYSLQYHAAMIVKRIVTNIATADVSTARRFYKDVLGLEIVMDQGWIATFAAPTKMSPQVTVAVEGGSGTPVPDISIEVDDLDAALGRIISAGLAIVDGPAVEHSRVLGFFASAL